MRRFALLAALGAAVLVAGCSVLRIAYEGADEYLRYRLDRYLDPQGDQVAELKASVEAFARWHRGHALPRYARLADEAGKRLARGLTPQDLDWGYDAVTAQVWESLRRAATDIAPLLDGLKPEQVERMREQFEEDNRKFARDFLRGTPGERKQKRMHRTVDRLEDWLGTLSPAQVERVRQFSERAPLTDELRSRDRRRWQGELLAMAKARSAQRELLEFAGNWERGRDPAFSEQVRASRAEFFALLIDLDRTLTPAQRRRAVERFGELALDFRSLASDLAAAQ